MKTGTQNCGSGKQVWDKDKEFREKLFRDTSDNYMRSLFYVSTIASRFLSVRLVFHTPAYSPSRSHAAFKFHWQCPLSLEHWHASSNPTLTIDVCVCVCVCVLCTGFKYVELATDRHSVQATYQTSSDKMNKFNSKTLEVRGGEDRIVL